MLCCTIYKSIPIYICGVCYYRDNNLHLHTIVTVTILNGNQGKLIVFGIGRWRRRRAFQIIFLRYFVPLANDNDITALDIGAISDTSALSLCLVMFSASGNISVLWRLERIIFMTLILRQTPAKNTEKMFHRVNGAETLSLLSLLAALLTTKAPQTSIYCLKQFFFQLG